MKYLPAPVAILLGLFLVAALTDQVGWDYAGFGFAGGWLYCAVPVAWAAVSRKGRS